MSSHKRDALREVHQLGRWNDNYDNYEQGVGRPPDKDNHLRSLLVMVKVDPV